MRAAGARLRLAGARRAMQEETPAPAPAPAAASQRSTPAVSPAAVAFTQRVVERTPAPPTVGAGLQAAPQSGLGSVGGGSGDEPPVRISRFKAARMQREQADHASGMRELD